MARISWLAAVLLLTSLTLVGCGGRGRGPLPPPSETPTPMSTPLPTIPPTEVPGVEGNPIPFVVVHADAGRAATSAAGDLSAALREESGLEVDVRIVESDREAVELLCAAFGGDPAFAWVSAPGYSAAMAQLCGLPVLVSQQGDATSTNVLFIGSEDSGIASLADLDSATFCRVAASDLWTWQAPVLLMMAEGLSPTTVLREVVDVADLDTLVRQVAAGDCDAAALRASDYERIADAEMDESLVRLETDLEVPLGVVLTAPETPLGIRDAVTEALSAIARTGEGSAALEALFGADSFTPPTDDTLENWDAMIAQTGFDFGGQAN